MSPLSRPEARIRRFYVKDHQGVPDPPKPLAKAGGGLHKSLMRPRDGSESYDAKGRTELTITGPAQIAPTQAL
jgi:hypothetical protein